MRPEELISIIVPVFNVERYLEQCLVSLMQQTYSEIEVILVNDGSTDKSEDICKKYCLLDKRFHLINQKNAGLGNARNAGLSYAHGKYVCYVDSDDYVHTQYVEILYLNLVRSNADLSLCNYQKVSGDYSVAFKEDNNCRLLTKRQVLMALTTTGTNNISEKVVVAWNKLIPIEIAKKCQFCNKVHEDEFMINDLLLYVHKIVWTDAELYFYRQRQDSITGEKSKTRLNNIDVLDALYYRIEMFKDKHDPCLEQKLICSFLENSTSIYYVLIQSYGRYKIGKLIYPRYIRVLLGNIRKLSMKQIARFSLFILFPGYYHRRYWPDMREKQNEKSTKD